MCDAGLESICYDLSVRKEFREFASKYDWIIFNLEFQTIRHWYGFYTEMVPVITLEFLRGMDEREVRSVNKSLLSTSFVSFAFV